MAQVTFIPSNTQIETGPDENLLRAAMRAGVHINASCGGANVCNKCKVFIEEGKVKGEKLPDGAYKACATVPLTDVVVRVPAESEMDRKALVRSDGAKAASWIQVQADVLERPLDPVIKKVSVSLPEPTLEDSLSDLERLYRELGQNKEASIEIDYPVLPKLPQALREEKWHSTLSILERQNAKNKQIINIEPGNKTKHHLGIAIDIGTTTVTAQLLDLSSGEILSESSDYNPQVSYGEDVISRMEFARKGQGLQILQEKIINCINKLIDEVFEEANKTKEDLSLISVAANSVMTHFLLALDPQYLRSAPYVPVATHFPPVRASEIGITVPDHVRMFLAPCVASYVGGDIVAGVVGSGLNRQPELTLFIDIGTNGEIVLGNQDWMACAACSAGPAFEGGGIEHGMRATTGAVEVVHIHPQTHEPMVLTIGGKKAKGICGSGIISLLAGLFTTGVIDQQGKFRQDLKTKRVRQGRNGWEYVVVEAEATQTGKDIVFTEADIENLIRAKGAMFAGYLTLLESVGMTLQDLERVVLAGNFGSYLDLEQAITIGLLPDIPRDRFYFAGNTSLLGAKAAALSKPAMQEQAEVAKMMTHFDLSNNPSFMDHYVSCLFLPHTDSALFPSVKAN